MGSEFKSSGSRLEEKNTECETRDASEKKEGMSLIVKTVTDWLKGFILVFGLYLVLYGHLTPGGGFSGGVVVACGLILLMLAEGRRRALHTVSHRAAEDLDSTGALAFLVVALLGMVFAGIFFFNFIPTPEDAQFKLLSAGTMPINNVAIGIKVGMSLFLVFAVLSVMRVKIGDKRESTLHNNQPASDDLKKDERFE